MIKEYTRDDALEICGSSGKAFNLEFCTPDGKKHVISGNCPDRLAETANLFVESELQEAAARRHYEEAVEALVDVALKQTGSGAKAAAQTLLSAYNSDHYQLKVTDLCHLDNENFDHAMNLILGRVKTFSEPHNVINNGAKVFLQLQEKYGFMRVG